MSLVLDCSLTMAWLYAEETTAAVRKVFELVEDAGDVGPLALAIGSR